MMDSNGFRDLLQQAIRGDKRSVEEIIKMYAPLIDRNSRIYGKLDEDLRQHLILKVASAIRKFKI